VSVPSLPEASSEAELANCLGCDLLEPVADDLVRRSDHRRARHGCAPAAWT
jgi:hypothetical protein